MAHQRKLIRQAVAALLVSANTSAAARVSTTRVEPIQARALPAISVYTLSEQLDAAQSAQSAPRELTRELRLEVAAWVAHSDAFPVDDAMDALAEQIEAAMDSDRYLGGSAAECIYDGTEMQVVDEDGHSDPLIGIVTVAYTVTYRTSPAVIGGDIQDFLTVDAKQTIAGGVPSTAPTEDLITVRSP